MQIWRKQIKIHKEESEQYVKIKHLLKDDQKARRGFFQKTKINIADSINRIKLLKIIKSNYYPGFISIGLFENFDMIAILLRHISIPNYNPS